MMLRHPSDSTAQRYAPGLLPAARPVGEGGDDKEHSGRLLLRMPRTLHAELARAAERRGVSLNQLIVGLLSHSLADGASSSAPSGSDAGETAKSEDAARVQRRLGVVLTVNLVVLVLAGAIAIALLIVAWSRGF